jgi:hypothetical protein
MDPKPTAPTTPTPEATEFGLPLDQYGQPDTEKFLPVVLVPTVYCPKCGRILQTVLDELKYGVVRILSCGDCYERRWYRVRVVVQIAERDWAAER